MLRSDEPPKPKVLKKKRVPARQKDAGRSVFEKNGCVDVRKFFCVTCQL